MWRKPGAEELREAEARGGQTSTATGQAAAAATAAGAAAALRASVPSRFDTL